MSIRRTALEALLDITERGAYANLRLKQAAEGLEARDIRWIYATVYGVLDHLLYLDYILGHFIKGTQKAQIRGILRMGVHALLFMRTPAAVACNESVNLVKEIGKGSLSGYVNGVLRAIAKNIHDLPPIPNEPAERLSIQYSWPKWLVEEWLRRFGEEGAEALLKAAGQEQGMPLRAHPPYTTAQLKKALEEQGISFREGTLLADCLYLTRGLDVSDMPFFQKGCITVQGEGAMLACRACGAAPGMAVLDACAAPGGKSAYLHALAHGKADIHAWDLHANRVDLIKKTLQRMNIYAEVTTRDATIPLDAYNEKFDLVLLDVPCSGLGVAGSKPDIRYSKSKEAIAALAHTQARILDTCAKYVKQGGILVYASCTVSSMENEEQITSFLKRNREFSPDTLAPYLPDCLNGLESGQIQLLPHVHHTEGFFIARMRRTG